MSNIKNAHIQGNLTISANANNVGDHGSGVFFTDYIQETTSSAGIRILNSNLDLYNVAAEQTQLRLTNDLIETAQLLLNGSANVSGNGVRSLTILNNSGDTYVQSKGGIGIKIAETTGNTTIQSTAESINSTTAALIVMGGASINKSIIVDKEIRGNDGYHLLYNTATSESVLQIQNTSTSGYSTVDFKDDSGVLKLQIGYGNSTSASPLTSQAYVQSSSGTLLLRSNNTDSMLLESDGSVEFKHSTPSTSYTTGAITSLGGIAISNTTDATAVGNGGALSIAGGSSIAKRLFVGTDLSVGNFLQMSNITTPTNPTSGKRFYIDSSDSGFKSVDSTGIIKYYNPSLTKGDLITHNGTTDSRLVVGNTNQILYADPALPNGIGWKNLSSETPVINPNISKYFEAYNSSNTTLTDAYTTITLDTVRTTDVDYFVYNNSELTILSSGTYMIIGKLTVENTTGNNETYASVVIQKGTSNVYSDLPGTLSNTFTFTLNQSPISSCTSSCIITLAENDQIRLQMKRDNVTETLRTYPNSCNLVVARVFIDEADDNSTYFNTYKTSNQTLTGSFTDILLQTNRIIGSSYSHTSGSAEVVFTETGIFFINMNIGFNKTSGTDYTQAETELSLSDTAGLNYTRVPSSLNYSYMRRSGATDSAVVYCILSITSGQRIKIRSRISVGTNVTCLANACQLNITKYQSTSNGQTNVKFIDIYSSATQTINSSYTDITFNVQRIINGIYSHTINNPDITVGESGKYILYIKGSTDNTNNNANNNTSTQMRVLLNTGNGYSAISGHLASTINVYAPAGKTTFGMVLTLSLSAGSSLKVQFVKLYASATVQTIADTCSFSIIKVEPEEQIIESILKFGTQYTYIESPGITSTTSTEYIQKLRLTTGLVPEGYYRLGCFFVTYPEVQNNDIGIQLILDNATTLQETTESRSTTSRQGSYIFKQLQLADGIHNIDLNVKGTTGSLIYVQDTRMELWRLF